MKKISFEDALILSTVKVARSAVRVLPLRASLFFARRLGAAVYYLTKRRQIATGNLCAAFAAEIPRSRLRTIARSSIENLTLSVAELLRFPDMDEAYLRRHIRIRGAEKLEPYKGKGVLFLTAHYGSWELLSVVGSLLGYPVSVLARKQKHPRSDDYLTRLRSCKGAQIIRKGIPVREILRALKRGNMVGIVGDQDAGRNGTFVRFLGRLSSTPRGVVSFARHSGAPVFPIFITRQGDLDHVIDVEDPLQVPVEDSEEAERFVLQQFSDLLEKKIRSAPEQWLWAHRRWKSTPDRSLLILSDGKSGHLNQSLAVLEAFKEEREAVGALDRVRSCVIEVRFKNIFCRSLLGWLAVSTGGRVPFGMFWLRACLAQGVVDEIEKVYADAVVSCGASMQPVNLIVSRENRAKSLVVMKPMVPSARFDAVIVPRHDGVRPAPNIFITERALTPMNASRLRQDGDRLASALHLSAAQKRLGLLVGGDTEHVQFGRAQFEEIVSAVDRVTREVDAVVLATTSRRTPAWADELLKRVFRQNRHCPLLVIANESNPSGTVSGILGASDVLLVSGESVSLVSEAVGSGKPVVVFIPGEARELKAKHREFLERMAKENRIIQGVSDKIYPILKQQFDGGALVPGAGPSRDEEALRAAVRKIS